ncbi:unnamed protein product [Rhizoctonia solani]|uniref:Uncharacterized protein n=1 Tax=Rhizoctonia solani TaxID=456999 RepID=A0A8H2XIW1_9AGAM|nr:unnamed protein product [Rhizoctonia solani]
MSGILWSRRPSAPDTSGSGSGSHIPPRARTTSGGGLAAFAGSVLSLSKAKSRERLRGVPKPSSNRQTVVSTESGSSDMWPNEPTTPSSASDTKQSFQGIGMGVGDDPFARPPVYVTKDKESPLDAFPDPPPQRTRIATPRNNSTGPLLFPDPGPSRHLHPPSPKSSSSKLSPTSSPNRSRSTSASSSVNPSAKSPRTPPPIISSVSTADMHAHADAFSWTESIYDPQVDIRPRYDDSRRAQETDRQDEPSIRRGQSAHAVLTPSSRLPPTPRLIHSASSSHLSSQPSPPLPPPPPPHLARAGFTAAGMGSMTALASGIVQGLEDEPRKRPPKRPSRSELRDRNDVRSYMPPERKASLQALRESAIDSPRSPASIAQVLEPQLLDPARSPDLVPRAFESSRLPNPTSPPRPRTASSPSRPQTVTSPRQASSRGRSRNPSSPRILPSSPRLLPSSPRILPSSPRLEPTARPARLSEDSLEDLDNYQFTIAPTIQEADAQSISFSELGFQLVDDEDVWSDDGVTFHHGPTDSLHYVSADSSRYGAGPSRRPPPSPTSLPFMAGNVRRRPRHDMVYPSGVDSMKLGVPALIEEEELVAPLERIPSMSTGSHTSSSSSMTPETVPQTISSHVAFSKHARNASYSDSELDFEPSLRSGKPTHPLLPSTQTAVAWRCGAGNHEKCCGTRAMAQGAPNVGQYKCCAERTPHGKNARCCASFVGRACERPRVSSTTSSASVSELGRQRSLHFGSLATQAPVRAKAFFHRPHTSHGKSTSSALLDDETRAIIQLKHREDPGPQSPSSSDVFATTAAAVAAAVSPPTSPVSRHEFKAKPIISPAKLQDHLKESRVSASPDPLTSPTPEPARARSNTTTTTSGSVSVRSVFSNQSEDAPAPLKSLFVPPRARRNQNVSLPPMSISPPVQQPRRYAQSITSSLQSAGLTRPQPISGVGLSSLSSGSSVGSSLGFAPLSPPPPPRTGLAPSPRMGLSPPPPLRAGLPPSPRAGLPPSPRTGLPPPRRDMVGRTNTQPIVSFISSRSAPTPHAASEANTALRHRSSRESYESCRTVRRERSIPLRETQMSFLEFGVEEEETDDEEEQEEEEEPASSPYPSRPPLSHHQSFLDFSRQSGDTVREQEAMFS